MLVQAAATPLRILQAASLLRHQRALHRTSVYAAEMKRASNIRLTVANLLCGLLPDFASGTIRSRVYRAIGIDIHTTSAIMGNLCLVGRDISPKLHIAENVVIGHHVTINLDETVRIEKNASISPHVLIYTGTHQIGPGSQRKAPAAIAAPVTLGTGCWIGLAAVIFPGVTVGHGAIVGAGAVCTKDVPPNAYVEGNPARVVRTLPWGDR